MADLADVESALVATIVVALYPNGPGSPSALPGAAAARAYRGWPNAAALDKDLAAGVVNVSVYTRDGMTRDTTRFPGTWTQASPPLATLSASVAGGIVTFSGSPGPHQLAGIRARGSAYSVVVPAGAGPAAAAAAVGALVPGATVSGAAVSVPGAPDLASGVVGYGVGSRELRRQQQGFLIVLWAPTPDLRDAAASVVDAALAGTDFLPLADGSSARLRYHSTYATDAPSKEKLWRRDLVYAAEYATTLRQEQAQMLFGTTATTTSGGTATTVAAGDPDIALVVTASLVR